MGTIASAATEANETLAIAECRRCLSLGVDMKAPYIKLCLDQLENLTVTDTSARTDVAPNTTLDGRNAAEIAVIT